MGALSSALAALAGESAVSAERRAFLGLVRKEVDNYDRCEQKGGGGGQGGWEQSGEGEAGGAGPGARAGQRWAGDRCRCRCLYPRPPPQRVR